MKRSKPPSIVSTLASMKVMPPRPPPRTRGTFTGIQEMLDISDERSKRMAIIDRACDTIAAAEAQGASHRLTSLWFDILTHPAYDDWLQAKVKGRAAWREAKQELRDSLVHMFLTLATVLAYLIWIPSLIYLLILFFSA